MWNLTISPPVVSCKHIPLAVLRILIQWVKHRNRLHPEMLAHGYPRIYWKTSIILMSRKGLRLCALLSKGRKLRGWTLRGKKFVRQMTGERQFTFCCHCKPSNALLCIYPSIVSGREKKAVLKNEVHKLMRNISSRPIDEDQEAGVRAHFVPEPKLSAGYFGPWAMGIIANTANDSFHPLPKPAKIELVELRNKSSTYYALRTY